MAGVGPMLGQAHHFRRYAKEPNRYAIERFTNEAGRIYQVLDRQLAGRDYLAGDYSIADMAVFPWIRPRKLQGQDLADFPNLNRWYHSIKERPPVQRGIAVLQDKFEQNRHKQPAGKSWDILFGQSQFERR
jgi:GSH-dependent disulfide-bond oxidoreductase